MTEKQKIRLEQLRLELESCPPGRALHILGKKKLEELLKLEKKVSADDSN